MDNRELLEEFRLLRDEIKEDIKDLRKEINKVDNSLHLFKGKALGFLSLLSVVINLAFDYVTTKK